MIYQPKVFIFGSNLVPCHAVPSKKEISVMQFHDELPSKKEILDKTILYQCHKISKTGSKIISSWLSNDHPDLEDLGSYSDRLATLWYARQVGETKAKSSNSDLFRIGVDCSCFIFKKHNPWQTLQFSKLEFFAFTGPSSNLDDDKSSVHEPICPASSTTTPVNTDKGSQSHKCKVSTSRRN